MKAMAIRLVEDKDPVMVLFGHYEDWSESDLFWRIDECCSPNDCEYMDYELDQRDIGFIWPTADLRIDGAELIESTLLHLYEIFDGEHEWTKINILIDYK